MAHIEKGDIVVIKCNGRKATVICNDRSSMPYHVRMHDTGALVWFYESDVRRVGGAMTICLSTKPVGAKGSLEGGIYILKGVEDLQAIPRKGSMTGFTQLDDLKDTLVRFDKHNFMQSQVANLSTDYQYVYRVVDGELVIVTDAKFEGEVPRITPFEQLAVDKYYRLRSDSNVDSTLKAGDVLKLVRQERSDYMGNLVYYVEKANTGENFWVERSNQLIQL